MSFRNNEKPKYNIEYNPNAMSKEFRRDSVQCYFPKNVGTSDYQFNTNPQTNPGKRVISFTSPNTSQSVGKISECAKPLKGSANDTTHVQAQKVLNFSNNIDTGCRMLSLKLSRCQQIAGIIDNRFHGILYEVVGRIENVVIDPESDIINFYIKDGHCVQKSVFSNMDEIVVDIDATAVYRFVGKLNATTKLFQCFKIAQITDEEFKIIKLFEVQSEKQLQALLTNITEA